MRGKLHLREIFVGEIASNLTQRNASREEEKRVRGTLTSRKLTSAPGFAFVITFSVRRSPFSVLRTPFAVPGTLYLTALRRK